MLRLPVVATLFLLSGGTALLYQVAFGKKLSTIFGATAYAVSAVLAAFMAGLALGAHLGGRYGERSRRPLAFYGVAEIVVGAVCAVTPWLFDGVAALYVSAARAAPGSLALVSASRAVITAAVVLVPTVAMGLTLPLLARAIAGPSAGDAARVRLATLYTVNTAGGALGALLSAYLVLPALGVYSTMRAAAVVNVAIGLAAIWLGREPLKDDAGERDASADEAPVDDGADGERGDDAKRAGGGVSAAAAGRIAEPDTSEVALLIALAAASGLLVFCAEVVDTHLLTLLIGNSAYAFGLMLAAFLTCLSAGAALAQPFDRRMGRNALPVALGLSAVALLATIPLWDQLPRAFLAAGWRVFSWHGRELVRAAVAFGALVLPTICMGLTFPLLLRRVAGRARVALMVGRLTAVNTVGSIVGSLLAGYFVLPWLGSEWSLRIIALGFALAAVAAGYWQRDRDERLLAGTPMRLATGALVTSLVLAFGLPRWDMKLMTNGANVYFDTQPPPDELLYVREDVHGGLTSVALRGKVRTLYTNGKFQGNDGGEITAQRSFAHFPSLFVKEFERVLVIGLGTGTTLGTIAAYPYRRIDVAEISPSIVEAAQRFFGPINGGALADARVKLQMNDGRNVLLLATEPYDLITIELTSVWFAGAANLYSEEFYQLCRERLKPAGVLQQWVQLHHIRRKELAVVLRTLRRSFEHVALFVSGGQGILVASREPLETSRKHLAALSTTPAIAATLPGNGRPEALERLLGKLMLSGAELDRFVADSRDGDGDLLSTDSNLYLEYATAKGNVMSYQKSYDAMVQQLRGYRPDDPASRHLSD
jgi:spermidine synthase